MFIYTVKKGDSVSKLSKEFNINQINIITDNNLVAPYTLLIGQTLIIDVDRLNYKVKENDTFQSLEEEYDIPISKIKSINNISKLTIGETITFDYKTNKYKGYVNGYCYQNLSEGTLNKYNKYLSTISPFAYKVKDDGTLDNFIIGNNIKNDNLPKVMVIANIKEKGGFSSEITHKILNDRRIKSILINNIIFEIKKENYKLLNVDFEYVNEDDKEAFIEFIIDMKAKLNEINKELSVCLAPKTSSFQKGLLYEAHDYQKIGKIADYLIIMTYEWGYTYGEPMAISPLPQVKDVIKYAKTVIPKEKIIMGIPNYGYDWTLPYKKGTAADSLSITEAMELALEEKVEIKHSKAYLTPYFNYKKDNVNHVVHFDDALSYKEKIELAIKENIGGISIWTLSSSNVTLTKLIDNYFEIRKF